MLGLVRTYIQQQRSNTPLAVWHLPVLDSHLRSLQILPLREVAFVEIIDCFGVGDDSLLFQVSDESMTDLWRDHVGEREAAEEHALRTEDHESHKGAWLGEFEECQQMHALVVGLLKECLDPGLSWLVCGVSGC